MTVVVSAGMIAVAAAVFVFHVTVQPVLSGSMRPTFDPGSAIVTRRIASSSIRVGDVIVFFPPGQASSFAHRVTSVSGRASRPVITTKGDANPARDPWHAEISAPEVPQVIGTIPALGRFLVAARHRSSRVLLLAAAGLVVCIAGTRSILGPVGAS